MRIAKRIVLLHTNGMYQIIGPLKSIDGQPPALLPFEAGVVINGRPVMLNLVQAKTRYYVYKELMLPDVMGPTASTGGSFNPNQK